MTNWKKALLSSFAAVVLGILLTLAFAPYDIVPFAVIAPAGLLLLWLNASPQRSFWIGYCFGLGLFGSGVYWVFISVHVYGMVPIPLALLITSGFIAILALWPAIVGYLLNRYFPKPTAVKMLCAFPAIWVYSEWVRSWVFTGFPWLFVGYTQLHSPLKGYAPIFSVYGLSLLTFLTSALLLRAYLFFKVKENRSAYRQCLFILAIWVVGGVLTLIPWTKDQGTPIKVSLVQGNIPQQIKWSPDHLQLSYDRYAELSKPLWGKSQLIIWPESAIPTTLQDAANYIDDLSVLAKKYDTTLILGIPIEAAKPKEGYYNSIISIGDSEQFYIKRFLVPFGEYTPYSEKLMGMFSFFNIPMSNMLPGKMAQAPLELKNVKISTSICYEITYPELIATNDPSLGLLLTITNDAWFDKSSAQAQHLQMAAMRALELRRPVLFVSNNGITAIIGPDGNILEQIPAHEVAVLTGSVQPRFGLTPWMQNKMAPMHIILLFLIFLAIREKYKKQPDNFWQAKNAPSIE